MDNHLTLEYGLWMLARQSKCRQVQSEQAHALGSPFAPVGWGAGPLQISVSGWAKIPFSDVHETLILLQNFGNPGSRDSPHSGGIAAGRTGVPEGICWLHLPLLHVNVSSISNVLMSISPWDLKDTQWRQSRKVRLLWLIFVRDRTNGKFTAHSSL